MPRSLPLNLVLAWSLLFCFLLAHEYHERQSKRSLQFASTHLLKAVEISGLLGFFTGLVILIYYFIVVAWYWPIVLFVGGSIFGAMMMGMLSSLIGEESLSKRAFIGWPLSALWAISIIHELK